MGKVNGLYMAEQENAEAALSDALCERDMLRDKVKELEAAKQAAMDAFSGDMSDENWDRLCAILAPEKEEG
jgi:hypothetical protein